MNLSLYWDRLDSPFIGITEKDVLGVLQLGFWRNWGYRISFMQVKKFKRSLTQHGDSS